MLSCNIDALKARAKLLNRIRDFFAQRRVIEVETPLLCHYAGTAPHIDPIEVSGSGGGFIKKSRFLQTSPEYAMKRLLAAGSGDLFQICKAFRANEIGKLHNPEFTILEWYRLGFDHHQLIAEILDLLCYILEKPREYYHILKVSYRDIFLEYLKIDLFQVTLQELKSLITQKINLSVDFANFVAKASRQDCQEILFSNCIEPYFHNKNKILIVYNYPLEQAGLAKIIKDELGNAVAARFEVYFNGIELANGYHELTDPALQLQRFLQDQTVRFQLGKKNLEIDHYLLQALILGLPECSGVALGIDRILMLQTNAGSIKEVIPFPWDLA